MRILLDECLPKRLKRDLAKGAFDVFLTVANRSDRNCGERRWRLSGITLGVMFRQATVLL